MEMKQLKEKGKYALVQYGGLFMIERQKSDGICVIFSTEDESVAIASFDRLVEKKPRRGERREYEKEGQENCAR